MCATCAHPFTPRALSIPGGGVHVEGVQSQSRARMTPAHDQCKINFLLGVCGGEAS